MAAHPRTTVAIAVAAAIGPLVITAGLADVGAESSQSIAAVLLAAGVVGIASSGRRSATVIAAVSSSVGFDYFLTTPYHSFAMNQPSEMITAASLLFVGMVAVYLRVRADRHREAAEDGRNDIARIHSVAELVAEGIDPYRIVEIVKVELIDLLSLRDCTFDRQAPRGDAALIERSGNVVIGELSWGVHKQGFPGDEVELPVSAVGVSVGRYVLKPTPGVAVSFDKRILAVALADQVGAAFALSLA